jgi:hypothetical protein
MYKVGDIVICKIERKRVEHEITIGKRYTVLSVSESDFSEIINITNDNNEVRGYFSVRFIPLPIIEYRKLKLKKICSKLETK